MTDKTDLFKSDNWEYSIVDDSVVITKYVIKTPIIIIPSEIDGKRVKAIGNSAFYKHKDLEKIVFPDGLTEIGDYAFVDCKKLKNVIIPDSVKHIGSNAFSGCTSLETINIPNHLTCIDTWVFYGCKKLKVVKLPDSVIRIKDYAFGFCDNLQRIVIPPSVTMISSNSFGGNNPEIIICGYKDTYAEKYAMENNLKFEVISEK